jgi:hypothetical protein
MVEMNKDLLIEGGSPEELEELRQELERELGRDAHVEPATKNVEYNEPITIGLIVAFGGPKVVKGVVKVVKGYMEHRERMQKMRSEREQAREENQLRFMILEDGQRRQVTLTELESS